MNAFLSVDHALSLGWSVIPVGRNKKPLLKTWGEFQASRATDEVVAQWKGKCPVGWAVVTGALSGVIVVDFDKGQGAEYFKRIGLKPHVRTGSGGFHLYVKHPGFRVKTLNSKSKTELGKQFPGVDIRGDGGYAVFSGRNDDGSYEWLRSPEPDPIEVLPRDLRLALGLERVQPKENTAPCKQPPNSLEDRILDKALGMLSAGDGRNDTGMWLACQLRDNHFSEQAAMDVLTRYQRHCPQTNTKGAPEPYTDAEVRASVRSAYSRAAREPWSQSSDNTAQATQAVVQSSPSEPLKCTRTPADFFNDAAFWKPRPRLATPWSDLNDALGGGLVACGLYLIAAATGFCKTTIGLNFVRCMALGGTKSLLVTLEDLGQSSMCRILAASARIPYRILEDMSASEDQRSQFREAVRSAVGVLKDAPLLIDETTNTLQGLVWLLRAFAAQGGKFVVIDQLSWISASSTDPYERASLISRTLKETLRETGLVCVLAVQLNREGSKAAELACNDPEAPGPSIHHLRDSGCLEQDADGIVLVRAFETADRDRPALLHLVVGKHRHGGRNARFPLTWIPDQARIESWIPSDTTGVM